VIKLENPPLPPGFHPVKVPSLNPGFVIILPDGIAGTQAVTVGVIEVVVVGATVVKDATITVEVPTMVVEKYVWVMVIVFNDVSVRVCTFVPVVASITVISTWLVKSWVTTIVDVDVTDRTDVVVTAGRVE